MAAPCARPQTHHPRSRTHGLHSRTHTQAPASMWPRAPPTQEHTPIRAPVNARRHRHSARAGEEHAITNSHNARHQSARAPIPPTRRTALPPQLWAHHTCMVTPTVRANERTSHVQAAHFITTVHTPLRSLLRQHSQAHAGTRRHTSLAAPHTSGTHTLADSIPWCMHCKICLHDFRTRATAQAHAKTQQHLTATRAQTVWKHSGP